MKRWISTLASLKLTVAILVLLLVVLAIGTVVESLHGTEAARGVYYSVWFTGLLFLFAINLACALVDRWPWGRFRIGFALTHAAGLVILLGAGLTWVGKTEGRLALWEGESSDHLLATEPTAAPIPLPFSVRLDAFEMDVYPGTHRPAMFRSRVTVRDSASGDSFPAVIEMNKELAYGGFRLFQSGYQQAGGREMSVLSVSRDPGQWVVFVGYGMLILGMAVVLTTRIVQRRRILRRQQPGVSALGGLGTAAVLLAALLAVPGGQLLAQGTPSAELVGSLRPLPVQHDGRTMPFDTLARETAWKVTGQLRWQRQDPVSLIAAWMTEPRFWMDQHLVKLGGKDLALALGLQAGVRHASYRWLSENARLRELIRFARSEQQQERPVSGVLEDALEVEGRLAAMHAVLTGEAVRVIPDPEDPIAAWQTAAGDRSPAALARAEQTVRAGNPPPHYPSPEAIDRELTYNRVDPSRLAWWILVPATLVSLLAWLRPQRLVDVLAVGGLFAGFAVMSWGIAVRWQVAGRIPAANMYESMLFLGWGVGLFALVASLFLRNRLVIFNATAMSALTMLLTDRLPVDRFIHPMPPVLSGTPWLAIHVPIIMVGYSVLALGVLVAHMQIAIEVVRPQRRDLVARAADLLYWYMHVGSLLLVAGILTGSIWAASSWGRYWGWDPKEVWSLIAFLAYMTILHGRFDRFLGSFGVAVASIVAFWSVLMTYLGVNFVLASGLHSYGFGASGMVRALLFWAVIEILFLAIGFAGRDKKAAATAA